MFSEENDNYIFYPAVAWVGFYFIAEVAFYIAARNATFESSRLAASSSQRQQQRKNQEPSEESTTSGEGGQSSVTTSVSSIVAEPMMTPSKQRTMKGLFFAYFAMSIVAVTLAIIFLFIF